MEYGIVSIVCIVLILVLVVWMENIKAKKTSNSNFFYNLEYLNAKKNLTQKDIQENDNVRKVTKKEKIEEEAGDTMEAKKWETNPVVQPDPIKKSLEETVAKKVQLDPAKKKLEETGQQRTQSLDAQFIKDIQKEDTMISPSVSSRDKSRKMEKSNYETTQACSPDKSQRIPGSYFGALKSSNIPLSRNTLEKKKVSVCKETDRFDASVAEKDSYPEKTIKIEADEEWKRILSTQEIIREESSNFEQALKNINSLIEELGSIPQVPNAEERYYELLLEARQQKSIPYSLECAETSSLPSQSIFPYSTEDRAIASSYSPKVPKESMSHKDKVEHWQKMIKWNG